MEAHNIILTRHPEGKRGACISTTDYYMLSTSIVSVLQQEEKVTLNQLIDIVQQKFDFSRLKNMAWRILVVKLDLEAKGLIKTVPHKYDRYITYLKLNQRAWKKQNTLALGDC